MFRLLDPTDPESSTILSVAVISVGVSALLAVGMVIGLNFHLNGQTKKLQSQISQINDTRNNLSDLKVSGDSTVEGSLNTTGDVGVTGDLDVTGDANFQNALNADSLSTTSNAQIGGDLTANGNTKLQDALTVSGSTTLDGDLRVAAGTTLSDSLDVSGETTLRDSLDVTGATTLANALRVNGAVSIGDSLDVTGAAKIQGAASIAGDLDVAGTINLGSSLDISGATSIGANLGVTVAKTINYLDVSATATLHNGLDVSGVATLGDVNVSGLSRFDSVSVSGATSLAHDLQVTGSSIFSDDFAVQGNATVGGDLTVVNAVVGGSQPAVDLGGTLNVTGATTLAGALDVAGLTTLHSDLDVSGLTTLEGLTVTTGHATTLNGTLTVDDATLLQSTLTVTANGDVVLGDLTVNGATQLNGSLTVGTDTVPSDATFGGNLNVTGAGQVNGDLNVDATAHFSNLNVDGYTTLVDQTIGTLATVRQSNAGTLIVYGTVDTYDTVHVNGGNIGVKNVGGNGGNFQVYDYGLGQYRNGDSASACGSGSHLSITDVNSGIVLAASCASGDPYDGGMDATCGGHLTVTHVTNGLVKSGTCNSGNDYAEKFPSTQTLSAGDVVSIDTLHTEGVVRSSGANDKLAIGIVSTEPGEAIGTGDYPIALSGRVPVKVTNEGGSIAAGDYLTTSSTPGMAKKAAPGEKTIGQALEAFTGVQGTVKTFVNISDGNAAPLQDAASLSNPNFASLNVSGVSSLTDLTVTGSATIANLTVTGPATLADITVNGHIVGNDDTRGTVTVAPGASVAHHDFTKPYAKAPVVVASPTSQAVLYTVSPTVTGFDVKLSTPATVPTSFDYLVQE